VDRFCFLVVFWPPWGCGIGRRERYREYRFDAESRGVLLGHDHFSQTLGTALGDWLADTGGLGYERGALVFTAALIAVVALYYWTGVSQVALFWIAFILTRPLGATVGDFVDKPVADGGLAPSRPLASAVIAATIVGLLIILPQRPGRHPGQTEGRMAARALSVGADNRQPGPGSGNPNP
jgi:hypothetical protein